MNFTRTLCKIIPLNLKPNLLIKRKFLNSTIVTVKSPGNLFKKIYVGTSITCGIYGCLFGIVEGYEKDEIIPIWSIIFGTLLGVYGLLFAPIFLLAAIIAIPYDLYKKKQLVNNNKFQKPIK